jgi:hypothetical protein
MKKRARTPRWVIIFTSNCRVGRYRHGAHLFYYYHLISQKLLEIEGKFKLQKCSACQDLQKISHSWKCATTMTNVAFVIADPFYKKIWAGVPPLM